MSVQTLLVDDSGTMRKLILRSLNAVGVTQVVEAANGIDGFARFQEQHFDLVLTDWNMPGKTGLELLKDIRAVNTDVPVVLITTESEKSRVLTAIQAGVTDYLIKPFESSALRAKLEKVLGSLLT